VLVEVCECPFYVDVGDGFKDRGCLGAVGGGVALPRIPISDFSGFVGGLYEFVVDLFDVAAFRALEPFYKLFEAGVVPR
jgi:hypothetical protein